MKPRNIALLGNPNTGKTSLFNKLTGSNQRVGNWSGVTVAAKSAPIQFKNQVAQLIDLPGCYTLVNSLDESALDEQTTQRFIAKSEADIFVCVLDITNLERNLYLTFQALEMGLPIMVVVNRIDLGFELGFGLNMKRLSQLLGCPVIPVSATTGVGILALKEALFEEPPSIQPHQHQFDYYPPQIQEVVEARVVLVPQEEQTQQKGRLIGALEGDTRRQLQLLQAGFPLEPFKQDIAAKFEQPLDVVIATARYNHIRSLIDLVRESLKSSVCEEHMPQSSLTKKLDHWVLNRFLGIPIFLGVMYLLFVFAIDVGGAFQDFFELGSSALFVDAPRHWLQALQAPDVLVTIIAYGLGQGLNTTITFIPVIASLFFALSFLEASGYMARAAFVMDRFMRWFGLPGKSFVPMIVGFGCNVPAVMGARTLDNKRERLLTILMSPFMSCGARLAIYAVFVTAFFPKGGHNVIFALYLIGIAAAILTGRLLRSTLLKGEQAPLVMELPSYRLPTLSFLLSQTKSRLKQFIVKAGALIIPLCMVLSILTPQSPGNYDILERVGRQLTPVFQPMGIEEDNWPAVVGLFTGVMAKEVVVGTLNTLYATTALDEKKTEQSEDGAHVSDKLKEAFISIPQNLAALVVFEGDTIEAKLNEMEVDTHVMGIMYQRFGSQAAAFSYLLFVLLYFPCISVVATMSRETHKGWAIYSVLWTTGLAYAVAVGFYQIATFQQHPLESMMWLFGILLVTLASVLSLGKLYTYFNPHQPKRLLPTTVTLENCAVNHRH